MQAATLALVAVLVLVLCIGVHWGSEHRSLCLQSKPLLDEPRPQPPSSSFNVESGQSFQCIGKDMSMQESDRGKKIGKYHVPSQSYRQAYRKQHSHR